MNFIQASNQVLLDRSHVVQALCHQTGQLLETSEPVELERIKGWLIRRSKVGDRLQAAFRMNLDFP